MFNCAQHVAGVRLAVCSGLARLNPVSTSDSTSACDCGSRGPQVSVAGVDFVYVYDRRWPSALFHRPRLDSAYCDPAADDHRGCTFHTVVNLQCFGR